MKIKYEIDKILTPFAKRASTSSPAQAKAVVDRAGWGSKGGNEEDKRDLSRSEGRYRCIDEQKIIYDKFRFVIVCEVWSLILV